MASTARPLASSAFPGSIPQENGRYKVGEELGAIGSTNGNGRARDFGLQSSSITTSSFPPTSAWGASSIWGNGLPKPAKLPTDVGHARSNGLSSGEHPTGSSSLAQSSEPDDWRLRGSSGWPRAGASSNPTDESRASTRVSPVRQRTIQVPRGSSPFPPQGSGPSQGSMSRPSSSQQAPFLSVSASVPKSSSASDFSRQSNGFRVTGQESGQSSPNGVSFGYFGTDAARNGYSGYNSSVASRNSSLPPSRHGQDPYENQDTLTGYSSFSDMNGTSTAELQARLEKQTRQTGQVQLRSRTQAEMMFGEMPTQIHSRGISCFDQDPYSTLSISQPDNMSEDLIAQMRRQSLRNGSFSSDDRASIPEQQQQHLYSSQQIQNALARQSACAPTSANDLQQRFQDFSFDSQNGGQDPSDHHRTPSNASLRSANGYQAQLQQGRHYGNLYNGHSSQMQPVRPNGYRQPSQLHAHAPRQPSAMNPLAASYQGQYGMYQNDLQSGLQMVYSNGMQQSPFVGGGQRIYNPLQTMRLPPQGPSSDTSSENSLKGHLAMELRNRNRPGKRPDLKDVFGQIVECCGDQYGSRYLQEKLESANSDEKEVIFREILPNALQLAQDLFGNYVIQKFFEHGNQTQKKILAQQMKGHIYSLSTHTYGCRCVQKAFEHVLVDQQAELVKELQPRLKECVTDANGNHVVQKAIERIPAEYIQFIIGGFSGQLKELSIHSYGCRVIQRLLENEAEPAKSRLLRELHTCAPELIMNPYGNYVIQHIIEHGGDGDRDRIIDLIMHRVLELTTNKFASNVVERCIRFGSAQQRQAIVDAISVVDARGAPLHLQMLIKHQYGNYVIQRILRQLANPQWDAFAALVRPQVLVLDRLNSNQKQVSEIRRILDNGPECGGSAAGSIFASAPRALVPTGQSHAAAVELEAIAAATPPPPLTAATLSPQSSSLPSASNSTVEGPIADGHKPALVQAAVDVAAIQIL